MNAFLLWLKNLINSFFYGQMSTADLEQMSQQERANRLDKMVDAAGDIKGVAKGLRRTLENFGVQLARARTDLDRETAALARAQAKAAASADNQQSQFEAAALQRSVNLAGKQVARYVAAIKDINSKIQNLQVRDQTAEYAVHWEDFQNRYARATDDILLADEAYMNSIKAVADSEKVLAGVGAVSPAEAFLERRRTEIQHKTDSYEGRVEVLDGVLRNRVIGAGESETVDDDVAAAIAESRKRLQLPDTASTDSTKKAASTS